MRSEARREVVAKILDDTNRLTRRTYDDLDAIRAPKVEQAPTHPCRMEGTP